MVQRLIDAMRGVAGKFTKERQLLLVLERQNESFFVLGSADPVRFSLGKHERVMSRAMAILSDRGKGPWPLFNSQNVVLPSTRRRRAHSFMEKGIEYDVLHIVPCDMLNQAEGLSPNEALRQAGITLTLLEEHPLKEDICRVLALP